MTPITTAMEDTYKILIHQGNTFLQPPLRWVHLFLRGSEYKQGRIQSAAVLYPGRPPLPFVLGANMWSDLLFATPGLVAQPPLQSPAATANANNL